MAGDWIKVEHVTPDKPEVIGIASHLGIDQDAVFGKLCRLWIWADQQTLNGKVKRNCNDSVTLSALPKAFIDRIACMSGFAEAMILVGWLTESEGSFQFPNFDRHNGQTAKDRALTYKRVKSTRKKVKRNCNGESVTKSLPETETETEKSNTPVVPLKLPETFDVPRVHRAFVAWFDYLTAKGKQPIDPNLTAWAATQLFATPKSLTDNMKFAMANGYVTIKDYSGSGGASNGSDGDGDTLKDLTDYTRKAK